MFTLLEQLKITFPLTAEVTYTPAVHIANITHAHITAVR